MNIKRIIFGNWQSKLIAFLAALAIWIYATASQSTYTNFPGKIPVTTENLKSGLVAILDNDSVEIKISVDSSTLSQVKEDNFSAKVDLNGLDEGTYTRSIDVSSKNPSVKVIAVDPNKTTVRIEKKITKNVPVRVRFDGSAAEEFVVSDSNPDPAEVKVSGPESVVNAISEAVAPIKLSGESDDFEKTAQLFVYTASGQEIKNVEIDPQSVSVRVIISRAGQTKTVGIRVKLEGTVADGYWISSIKTDPEVVVISGTRSGVASTSYLETEPVDVSAVDSGKTVSAKLIVPTGLTVADRTSSIQVTIEVRKFDATKDVYVAPKFNGLGGDLNIKSFDPQQVKVTIGGTQDTINSLPQDAVSVNVSLAGLGDGDHEVKISNDNVSLPNSISLISVGTDTLRVTLSKK